MKKESLVNLIKETREVLESLDEAKSIIYKKLEDINYAYHKLDLFVQLMIEEFDVQKEVNDFDF